MGFAVGLFGAQPLQRLCVGAGFVPNGDGVGAIHGSVGENEQFGSQNFILTARCKTQYLFAKTFSRGPNVLNLQAIRVQTQRIRLVAVKG